MIDKTKIQIKSEKLLQAIIQRLDVKRFGLNTTSRIVGLVDIEGCSGYFYLSLSANSAREDICTQE